MRESVVLLSSTFVKQNQDSFEGLKGSWKDCEQQQSDFRQENDRVCLTDTRTLLNMRNGNIYQVYIAEY